MDTFGKQLILQVCIMMLMSIGYTFPICGIHMYYVCVYICMYIIYIYIIYVYMYIQYILYILYILSMYNI